MRILICLLPCSLLWLAHCRTVREHAWRQCSELDYQSVIVADGILVRSSENRLRLIRGRTPTGDVLGDVFLGDYQAPRGRLLRVLISGRCFFDNRNPSKKQDGLSNFSFPRIVGKVNSFRMLTSGPFEWLWEKAFSARERFWDGVQHRLGRFPILWGLSRATWFGDMSGLPEVLTKTFKDWGLMHVLALSGQHVVILAIVVKTFLNLLAILVRPAGWIIRGAPLLLMGVLMVTSLFTSSVIRVMSVGVAAWIVRQRGLNCSAMRLLWVSAITAVVINPSLISALGFWLSLLGVGNLLLLSQGEGFISWCYLFLMPLFMMPMLMHLFGAISPLSPIAGPIVGSLWEGLILPIGFVLPFVPEPLNGFFPALERLSQWCAVSFLDSIAHRWTIRTVRPTYTEWIALTILLGSFWSVLMQQVKTTRNI